MGATNTTANYSLSQFISTDKPAWLQDYNGDMLKIDNGINAAKLSADSAANAASSAQNDATTAVNSVTSLSTTVGALSTSLGNLSGTVNTITSLIGNGTPTTTDQTIIGAINELHANQGHLSDLTTTDKTSLVAAINEVAGGGGGGSVAEELQTASLAIGATSVTLTFTDETIGASTMVLPFTSEYGVAPTAVSTTATTVVMTFEALDHAITVGALVKN